MNPVEGEISRCKLLARRLDLCRTPPEVQEEVIHLQHGLVQPDGLANERIAKQNAGARCVGHGDRRERGQQIAAGDA